MFTQTISLSLRHSHLFPVSNHWLSARETVLSIGMLYITMCCKNKMIFLFVLQKTQNKVSELSFSYVVVIPQQNTLLFTKWILYVPFDFRVPRMVDKTINQLGLDLATISWFRSYRCICRIVTDNWISKGCVMSYPDVSSFFLSRRVESGE